MSVLKAALGALGYAGSAYMNDAVMKPRRVGKLARDYCDRVGKRMLLIRAPRLTDKLFGEPIQADITTSRAYPLPVPDGTFGAIVVANVLEGLKRPDLALREWRRVADKVFVVVPSWWSPQAWLDPTNRWLIDPNLKRIVPLWTDRRKVYLLPVSDNRYGRRPWSHTKPSQSPIPSSTTGPRPSQSPSESEMVSEQMSQPFPDMDHLPSSASPAGEGMVTEAYDESDPIMLSADEMESTPSHPLASNEASQPGASSNSPRALMVVSSPRSDDG